MTNKNQGFKVPRINFLQPVLWLSIGLLFMGFLRYSATQQNILTPLAGLATPGYVLITVIFTIRLVRKGLPLNRFGFGTAPNLRLLILAAAAIFALRLINIFLSPLLEELIGEARNLERFAGVAGSVKALFTLLLANWTLNAFGEEFAYRIVLMRGIAFLLGDSRWGNVAAVIIQAIMFGLIHAYQGPTGIVGSTISGMIFGIVTVYGGWSI